MELGTRIQALMNSGRGGGKMKATISVDTQVYRCAQAAAVALGSGISEVLEALMADWLEAVQTTSICTSAQKAHVARALKQVLTDIQEVAESHEIAAEQDRLKD